MKRTFSALILVASTLLGYPLLAQEDVRQFSATTGPLLPNQIDGVTEIMSLWGFRYKPKDWNVEFGFLNGNEEGVAYNDVYFSFRGEQPFQGLMTIMYAGLDNHYYRASGSGSFTSAVGAHLGGGMMAFIGDRVWFRSEMRFHFNPGTALFIGFGFNFMLSE